MIRGDTIWPRRRRTLADDDSGPIDPKPSESQRLRVVEKRVGWLYAGLASLVAAGLSGGAAYYRSWEAGVEARGAAAGAAAIRLDRIERDVADLRATVFALYPFLRNPPARPAPGDDR